ncbi:GNAT family N-acetyltransferase [Streptomyces piniterrae]|uniref:GNAT family N-acetyltransferase n=1 Tax=Streptomyces piniterrae TaxID=2571125 RepID=A0A4U0NSE6_9ACTN|nr:GNAT family N-acetyltransferase [Streptomyces piniterrae]TJZ56952.1 GNAT family N-acetyltransferase [Streptomyces piniterrae]
MTWTTTQDLDAFEASAGAFLRARPAEHTVLLSVTASLRAIGADAYGAGAPWFGWWRRGGAETVGAAFVWTPPRTVLLSPMPQEAAAEWADEMSRRRLAVPGVNAGRAAAEAAAAAWQRSQGGTVRTAERARLYRLGALIPPAPAPPGAARLATTTDRDLLIDWFTAFAAEVGDPPPRDARAVDDRIAHGRCTLWEVDGHPVAMAGVTRTLFGTARVAPVYTPPDLRGRGYAGAVTAAVSRAAQAADAAELLLFADLDNPTSNALYQRLGYRPVEDHLVLEFDPEPDRP